MKKVKVFGVAAGLLLITAGVFAGKAKFASNVFSEKAGVYTDLGAGQLGSDFSGTAPAGASTVLNAESDGGTYLFFYKTSATPTFAPYYFN